MADLSELLKLLPGNKAEGLLFFGFLYLLYLAGKKAWGSLGGLNE